MKPSEANGRSTDSGSEFDATHTSPEDYPAVYVNNVDSHKHSDGKKIINDSASPTNVKVASSASQEVSKRTDTGTNYGTYDSVRPTPQPNSELFE